MLVDCTTMILFPILMRFCNCVIHMKWSYIEKHACTFRFGLKEGSLKKGFNLYTINIPVKRQTKPDPCFITQWDGVSYKPRLVMNAGTEVLSSLAVRYGDTVYITDVHLIGRSLLKFLKITVLSMFYICCWGECLEVYLCGLEM